ncbi:uroplakin-3b-like [Discoglossus pictus]
MLSASAFKLSVAVLVTFLSTVNGQITLPFVPTLFPNGIGSVTSSGFNLAFPNCVFTASGISPTDTVYLLVADRNVSANLNFTNIDFQNFPSFQNRLQNGIFLTLPTPAANFGCVLTPNGLSAVRVGIDPTCILDPTRPFCNGPLTTTGPFRVRFIVVNENGTVVAQTLWSDDINLRRPRDPSSINTDIVHRSASMIVITTVLAVLLAGLFALYSGLLFQNCCKICCCRTKSHQVQSCPN